MRDDIFGAARFHPKSSIMTPAGRAASWSMLSGLSLSEVSHIAILAIPIYPGEVSDADAYDFESSAVDPA